MFRFKLLVTSIFLGAFSFNTASLAGTLVCLEGRPFVKKLHLERGCSHGSQPYYASLNLTAPDERGGNIDFKIEWAWEFLDPKCDNPRGVLVIHHMPLPIYEGVWEISEEGVELGSVSLQTVLSCRIKGPGSVIQ